jgi:hypothetical protein
MISQREIQKSLGPLWGHLLPPQCDGIRHFLQLFLPIPSLFRCERVTGVKGGGRVIKEIQVVHGNTGAPAMESGLVPLPLGIVVGLFDYSGFTAE